VNSWFMRVNVRSRFVGWAVSWCACAAIFGSQVPARGDDAGDSVLKSARWRGTALPGERGQSPLAEVPGGGPIIAGSGGRITALDRATGRQIWSTEGYVMLMGVSEKAMLIYKADTKQLLARSPADGSLAYNVRIPREFTHALPGGVHVMGKTVIFQSNTLTVVQPDITAPTGRVSKAGPPVLFAYDLDTGKEIWKNDSPENKDVNYAVNGVRDYSRSVNMGIVPALFEIRTAAEQQMIDPATGKTVWSVPRNGREHEPLTLVPGEVRSADGTWYFLERVAEGDLATNGFQLIAREGATGKIVGQYKIPYSPGTLTTVTGKLAILREPRKPGTVKTGFDAVGPAKLTEDEKKDKLAAIDIQSGKIAWAVAIPTEDPNTTRIRVADDLLLLEAGSRLIVLDRATGQTLWSNARRSNVVMHKDIMIFITVDEIVGVNRRDGKMLWSIPCPTPCDPLIADGTLYLSIGDSGGAAGRDLFAIPLENNPALAGPRP
jgi:hypothetical protein